MSSWSKPLRDINRKRAKLRTSSADRLALANLFRTFENEMLVIRHELGAVSFSRFFDRQPVLFSRSFDTPCKFRVHLEGVQFEARFIFACTGYIQQAF